MITSTLTARPVHGTMQLLQSAPSTEIPPRLPYIPVNSQTFPTELPRNLKPLGGEEASECSKERHRQAQVMLASKSHQ